MALKLRVISDHYKTLGPNSSRLFGVTGGRIGRAADNDWVLPDRDRYVSSHHCKVHFRAGQWILEDTSTNGVFVNGSDTPVSIEGPYKLQDGDRLRMGDYEILVSIDDRNDFPPDASGQLPVPPLSVRTKAKSAPASNPALGEDLGEEIDITDLLSDEAIQPPSNSFDWDSASAAAAVEAAPAKPAKKSAPIPTLTPASAPESVKPVRGAFASLLDTSFDAPGNDDWQMQTRPYDRKTMQALTNAATLSRVEPERPKRPAETHSDSGVEAFCRGAGIDPSALPSDAQTALLTLAGQVVREMVLGLMEALKGRSDMKSRLRLSQTTIQPAENNPLKFSASVDEAVLKMFDPHSSRYLGPVEAIREAFADLRTHQSALVSAVKAATDDLMSRIEPGELQERFDRGLKRGAILGAANKMKYWDLYVEFYQALNQRNEQGLPTVFAEEFARTYAERVANKGGPGKKKK
ncbi:MAG TPA: type VI secretion system-associated FHA domain protein TagH [Steroidobacteraceae bacterium]